MQGTYYSLKIADPDPKVVPEEWLRRLLDSVITYFKLNSSIGISSADYIGMLLINNVCGTGTDPECIYFS